MPQKPLQLGPESAIGPGERSGPGFEGARCPSCDAFLRVKPGSFGDEFACPCGCVFELDSLACLPMENETVHADGTATMLVVAGADPEGTETVVGEPKPAEALETRAQDPDAHSDPKDSDETAVERCTTRFGRYRIVHEVARGGMGVVYRAIQEGLKREVALKMLLQGDGAGEEQVKRFIREAESAARLSHPNIVKIHDVGVEDGKHYFAMEFLEGESVAQVLARMGRIPPRQALRIARDSALALQFAHENGIVHRDVKPANIMLSPARSGDDTSPDDSVLFSSGVRSSFRVVLTDFGLAKDMGSGSVLTVSGATLGTPVYMPPEQADADTAAIGPRSDVYSLGAVLYEMVTGAPPFSGPNIGQILSKVIHDDPTPPRRLVPGMHRDLETMILTAMAKEPGRRYQTAGAFARDVEHYLKGEAIEARPAGPLFRAAKFVRRHKAASVATILVLAVAAAAVVQNRLEAGNRRREAEYAALSRFLDGSELAARGKYIEAETAYARALTLMPDFAAARDGARSARLTRLMGNASTLIDEEQWKAAGLVLEEILSLAPTDPEAARLSRIQKGTGSIEVRGVGFEVYAAAPGAPLALPPGIYPPVADLAATGVARLLGTAPLGPLDVEPRDFWLVFAREGVVESAHLLSVKRGENLVFDRRILRVDADGGGDFKTIGEALESATAGSVIEVGPGEYAERLEVRARALAVRAAPGARPRITASGDKWLLHAIGADGLRIEGLDFKAAHDHVLLVESTPGFVLLDCRVEGGTKESVLVGKCARALLSGLEVTAGKEPGIKIENSVGSAVVGNRVHDVGWAGIICSSDETSVAGNAVSGCTRAGIFVNLSRRAEIVDNFVRDCEEWGIIFSEKTYSARASHNFVQGIRSRQSRKGTGISMGRNDGSETSFNTVVDSLLGLATSFSPRTKCSDNIVTGCDVGLQWHESGDMDHNCVFGCKVLGYMIEKRVDTLEELRKAYEWKGRMMEHGLTADPLFRNPSGMDFSLKPESPCRKAVSNGGNIGAEWSRVGPVVSGKFDRDRWIARFAGTRCARESDLARQAGRLEEAAALLRLGLLFRPGDPNLQKKLDAFK